MAEDDLLLLQIYGQFLFTVFIFTPQQISLPTPFNDPAVTSERCAISPESIPELRMRRNRMRRLDRKSDELHRFGFLCWFKDAT